MFERDRKKIQEHTGVHRSMQERGGSNFLFGPVSGYRYPDTGSPTSTKINLNAPQSDRSRGESRSLEVECRSARSSPQSQLSRMILWACPNFAWEALKLSKPTSGMLLSQRLLSKPISVLYYSCCCLKDGGICITLFDTMRLVNPYSPHTPSYNTSPISYNTSPNFV